VLENQKLVQVLNETRNATKGNLEQQTDSSFLQDQLISTVSVQGRRQKKKRWEKETIVEGLP